MLTDYTSEGHSGTAIPAGAAGEQGLWLHAAPSSTPCMPGCHLPGAPLPHHPSPGPQPRVSAVVGASRSAWLTSEEGRCPLRGHVGCRVWGGTWWARWPFIWLGCHWPSSSRPSRSLPFQILPSSFSPRGPREATPPPPLPSSPHLDQLDVRVEPLQAGLQGAQ